MGRVTIHLPSIGKADPRFMEGVVYSSLGRRSRSLVVGPNKGQDNAVISLGGKRVMILTVDPVSIIPTIGTKVSAWLSVHLIASDYTTSGLKPQYATFSFNFPTELSEADRVQYVRSVGEECRKLGITIVAGHTGCYPGAGFTVIGAGSMFGFGIRGGFIDTSMAMPGDAILMTKQAGIETTASLALSFPHHIEQKIGRVQASIAKELVMSCSTVIDAFTAARVGLGRNGITSMHDATEGGVMGGLDEMAYASGMAFRVDVEKIPVSGAVTAVCGAFGLDPLSSLSEGTLLLTCRRNRVEDLKHEFTGSGIPIHEVGSVMDGKGLWVAKKSRRPARFKPRADRYWDVYTSGIAKGLE